MNKLARLALHGAVVAFLTAAMTLLSVVPTLRALSIPTMPAAAIAAAVICPLLIATLMAGTARQKSLDAADRASGRSSR